MRGYVDLEVWNRAMDLAASAYDLSRLMPRSEVYGMTAQMLRAATSVPANIAEGYQRGTRRDYARFVSIARGSLAETETFVRLAIRVGHVSPEAGQAVLDIAGEVGRMLTRLRQRLEAGPSVTPTPNP